MLWRTFSAAPHRLFFAAGIALLLFAATWWFVVLVLRQAGVALLQSPVPAVFVHGGFMLLLVFAPFMFGFLLTVFPRWQPAPAVPRNVHVAIFVFMNVAHVLFIAGMYSNRFMLAAALGVLMLAWMLLIGALVSCLAAARQRVPHALTVLVGLLCGFLGVAAFFGQVASGNFSTWPLVRGLGLWGFLVPVYFSVCHRMVPFFTSRVVPDYVVYRPDALLYAVVALAVARALLEPVPEWRWLVTVPLAGIATWFWWKWRPRKAGVAAMLAVLHIAYAWFAVALLMYAAQDIALSLGYSLLGNAPMHALGIGYFGGMLLAMVTRVTLGHSGRELFMNRWTWYLFLLLQLTALSRIAAEFSWFNDWGVTIAAAMWLFAFAEWARRHAGIYFRPRCDGVPG